MVNNGALLVGTGILLIHTKLAACLSREKKLVKQVFK
jgi:hypothetical protein